MIKRDKQLYFRRGYKYVVSRDYHILTPIIPDRPVNLPHIKMDMTGYLIVKKDYPWNGASGPTWDTLNSMIGSLIHDVIYELIRLGHVDIKWKEEADKLLHDICTEDGMWSCRADYWRWAVLKFGDSSCLPSAEPPEEVAP